MGQTPFQSSILIFTHLYFQDNYLNIESSKNSVKTHEEEDAQSSSIVRGTKQNKKYAKFSFKVFHMKGEMFS